ncbi:MAG: radical SAM protein, partial [Mobilitalea sp.]
MNLELMHIQLTDRCPLSCSQCYCPTNNAKDLSIQVLEERVEQAAAVGIRAIALSGGEPLVYPELLKAMRIIKKHRMYIYLSTSGYGLTDEFLQEMIDAGLDELFISINGSSEEIHNCSRSEFSASINALKICRRVGKACSVNWVAQRTNCYDLPELVKLTIEYKVKQVCVLLLKPDSCNMTGEMPDREQLLFLHNFLGNFKDK